MQQDKAPEKLNQAFPLDIERERELFEAALLDFGASEGSLSKKSDGSYDDFDRQAEFEIWKLSAGQPRPVSADPAQTAQPIGQAWGVWCDRAYRESGFVNYDGIITLYNENKANEMVEKFKEMNLEPFKYEKRPLYIYDAPQPAQAPAAPEIKPNVWLQFKDAPRDLNDDIDLWDQKEGRIPDCYFDSLLLRWRNSFGVVRVSNVTHFMVVNPPIDFLME